VVRECDLVFLLVFPPHLVSQAQEERDRERKRALTFSMDPCSSLVKKFMIVACWGEKE